MPATATAVKVCKKMRHDGTERVKCKEIYQGTECPKRSEHMLPFPTGYCNEHGKIGQHEGQRPKTGGKPMPTCTFWQTCPCVCHKQLDEMFKASGMERVLMENSEYVPDLIEFHIEDYIKPEIFDIPFETDPVNGHDTPEGTAPATPPSATGTPSRPPITQRRLSSGYAARGTLEAQVWEQCAAFADVNMELTPAQIAELIVAKYNIPTPSTGAIGSVFNRWEKLGFIEQGRKPIRFLFFCGKGTWEELEIMKGKLKREKKQMKSEQRRGFRR